MKRTYQRQCVKASLHITRKNMAVLIDTSFLVAASSSRDTNHILARRSMEIIGDIRIVPEPVLPEMFYMLTRRVGCSTTRAMFRQIRSESFQIEPLTDDD